MLVNYLADVNPAFSHCMIFRQSERQTDRWTDGQINGQPDKRMDK